LSTLDLGESASADGRTEDVVADSNLFHQNIIKEALHSAAIEVPTSSTSAYSLTISPTYTEQKQILPKLLFGFYS
jgi:hypothetical protein